MVAEVDTEVDGGFKGEENGDPTGGDLGAVLVGDARVGQGEVGAAGAVIGEVEGGDGAAKVADGAAARSPGPRRARSDRQKRPR